MLAAKSEGSNFIILPKTLGETPEALANVTESSAMYADAIGVPFQTPVPIVPTPVILV